jgi:hypothetical protein
MAAGKRPMVTGTTLSSAVWAWSEEVRKIAIASESFIAEAFCSALKSPARRALSITRGWKPPYFFVPG